MNVFTNEYSVSEFNVLNYKECLGIKISNGSSLYLFEKQSRWEKVNVICYSLVHSPQKTPTACTGPGWSQAFENPSKLNKWVAWAKYLENTLLFLQDHQHVTGMKMDWPELKPVPRADAGTAGSSLNHCAVTPAPGISSIWPQKIGSLNRNVNNFIWWLLGNFK